MTRHNPPSRGRINSGSGQNGAILNGLRVPGGRAMGRRMTIAQLLLPTVLRFLLRPCRSAKY